MNWYCISTRPSKEDQVEAYLSGRLGLEAYAPRFIQPKTMRGFMTEVAAPLFPKLLFCRFTLTTHYHAVRQAPEVVDLVRCGKEPAAVDPAVISQLKTWAGEGVDILNFQPGVHGPRVEIMPGQALTLPLAIIKSPSACERVALLLAILEKNTPAPGRAANAENQPK